MVGTLFAIIIMWNYDLTEEKANEIRKELDARKAAAKEGGLSLENHLVE